MDNKGRFKEIIQMVSNNLRIAIGLKNRTEWWKVVEMRKLKQALICECDSVAKLKSPSENETPQLISIQWTIKKTERDSHTVRSAHAIAPVRGVMLAKS